MSKTNGLWQDRYADIDEDYKAGKITVFQVKTKLRKLGLGNGDIFDHVASLVFT